MTSISDKPKMAINSSQQHALDEVMRQLQAVRGENPFAFDMFKTELEVLHVPRPLQKQLCARGFSFNHLSVTELRKIWRYIWSTSGVLEARLLVLDFYRSLAFQQLFAARKDLYFFAAELENWCESDYLSELLAELREHAPQELHTKFAVWNKHRNPWLRRQSVVSLFFYQRKRTDQPPVDLVLDHVSALLTHPEHYVQKGVGWTLREAIQVYPGATYTFLEQNLTRLSATAFTTVMEKVDPERKQHFKQLRKQARAQRSP